MKKIHLVIFTGILVVSFAIHFGRLVFFSLTDFNMLVPPNFIGLENYRIIIRDDFIFPIALRNTLVIYSLSAVIVGMVSLLIHEVLHKYYKTALYWCAAVLLVVSLCLAGGLLDPLLMDIWDSYRFTRPFEMVLVYFIISTLGVLLALLSIPYERLLPVSVKYLRLNLAFTLPIIIISFLENSAMRITGFPSINYEAHTLYLHAWDRRNIRLEAGYAYALSVINVLVKTILIASASVLMAVVSVVRSKIKNKL